MAVASWLALPLMLLLFAQWPLREVAHGYSREANDVGQWLFALFVAVSVTAATRAGTHLRAPGLADRYSDRTRAALGKVVHGCVLGPWSLIILVTGWPSVASSIRAVEHFPDSGNPGYFLVKAAVLVMAGLVLLQSCLSLLRPVSPPP